MAWNKVGAAKCPACGKGVRLGGAAMRKHWLNDCPKFVDKKVLKSLDKVQKPC